MRKIYGIDLGTTNSIIGISDRLLTKLVPSVVDLSTGKAGRSQLKNLRAVRSFKKDIRMEEDGMQSIVASARVLKELVLESKEDVHEVVISVPAYFSDSQRQATISAAERIGLCVVDLINEPTAAAIYASQNRKSLSIIFDLGGGTFDVTIIDSRFGDYDVQSTDGNPIGGDDFDRAIFKNVLKVADLKYYHLSEEQIADLLQECTALKIKVQKSKKDETLDLSKYGVGTYTLTVDVYKSIMKLIFGPAILKTRRLLESTIPYGEQYDLIMVGGSTRCPFLQEWITEELGQAPIPMFYDPDYVVAQGAAMYAQMVADGTAYKQVSDVTKALSIERATGGAIVIIPANSKIPVQDSIPVTNVGETDTLDVKLYQGNSAVESSNEFIGRLRYPYGEVKNPNEGLVVVTVNIERSGIIHLSCKEVLKPEVSITIERNASRD